MFIPITCEPTVPITSTIGVWLRKDGNLDPCWLPACCQSCIVARIAMGSA